MKWKQFLLIVAVSALSAVGSVWIYGKYAKVKHPMARPPISYNPPMVRFLLTMPVTSMVLRALQTRSILQRLPAPPYPPLYTLKQKSPQKK